MFIFIIIGLMIGGVAAGYVMRNRKLSFVHQVITLLIWILLFLLGVEVGNNEAIIKGLHTIGLEALIITLAAVVGTILGAGGLWRFISGKTMKGGEQ